MNSYGRKEFLKIVRVTDGEKEVGEAVAETLTGIKAGISFKSHDSFCCGCRAVGA